METGIAYIITNEPKTKHKPIFESMCRKSMQYAKQHLNLPTALISIDSSNQVQADYHLDANVYLKQWEDKKPLHGLMSAELLKTYICDWSPFEKTLYLDCDVFVINHKAIDFLKALDYGFRISICTCVTQNWKDSIASTNLSDNIIKDIPLYFPYWNFGIFGINKSISHKFMESVRSHYLSYCFKKSKFMSSGGVPHAQPAVVRTAMEESPDHKIFTMPASYNCHLDLNGGYAYTRRPTIVHMWKDIREMLL